MTERAPDFVYVTYIAAAVDKVWNGLIDREVTKAYWGHYNESDWTPGSRWQHVRADGSGKIVIVGKVVEIDPPRRLVITWALPRDEDDEARHSRVTFELEALGQETRLTVTHSDLERDSAVHRGITRGWPVVLSNFKTLLETGQTLSNEIWNWRG